MKHLWVFLTMLILLAAGGLAQDRPQVALLCIAPVISGELLEEATVDRLQAMRARAGLSRTAVPILQYSLDRPVERKFCEQQLHILDSHMPFLGVASYRMVEGAAAVDHVLFRVDNVSDYEAACQTVFTRLLQARQHVQQVGVLVVSAHQHPPLAGADALVTRLRNQEQMVRTLAERTASQMQSAGFPAQFLRVLQGTGVTMSDAMRTLVLTERDLPFVGLVSLSGGAPRSITYRLDGSAVMNADDAARRLTREWTQQLAYLRAPRTYRVALRTVNGQYVCVEDGNTRVQATAHQPAANAIFSMVDLDGAVLQTGHRVVFMTDQGTYFQAEEGGGKSLLVRGKNRGAWETFIIQKVGGGGEIQAGDAVMFRTDRGMLWTALNGGGGGISNKGNNPGVWERFTLDLRR